MNLEVQVGLPVGVVGSANSQGSKASWIRDAIWLVLQGNGEVFGVKKLLVSQLVLPVNLIGSAIMQDSKVSNGFGEGFGVTNGLESRMLMWFVFVGKEE